MEADARAVGGGVRCNKKGHEEVSNPPPDVTSLAFTAETIQVCDGAGCAGD